MTDNEMFLEEHMRTTTCFGQRDQLNELILKDVNINSKNHINRWTALHWAASRSNFEAVYIFRASGELPCDFTTSDNNLVLLGGKRSAEKKPSLPIIPNYIRNPPFLNLIKLNNEKESPVNLSEISSEEVLILKLRLAHSSGTDFIETKFNKFKFKLTFDKLKEIYCEELDIKPHHDLKIRKLTKKL